MIVMYATESDATTKTVIKIVMEIEEGLQRKEANLLYGLGKSTFNSWMKRYGSTE